MKKRGVSFIFIFHFLEDVLEISDYATALKDSGNNGDFDTKKTTKEELIYAMMGKSAVQKDKIEDDKNKDAQPVLEIQNLCSAGKFNNINYKIRPGTITGVCGLLGAGKSEIARAIYGLDKFDSGKIIYKGQEIKKTTPKKMMKNHVAIVTEDRKIEGFVPLMSISENISISVLKKKFTSKFGFVKEKERAEECLKIAKEVTVKMSSDKQRVESLSGGNQQKVIIGR